MEVLTGEMIRRLKSTGLPEQIHPVWNRGKGNKKAQEIEPKSNTFSVPKPERDLNNE
jgi:hypothetical protein